VLTTPAGAQERGPTIVWGGDTTLGSSYGRPPDRGWPQLAPVATVLRRADVAALNLEGTFGSGGTSKCGGGSTNCFAFQAPSANAATLARAGVDVVNQANNHAYDFGPAGFGTTRAALRAAKVAYTGAPGEVRVVRRNGFEVAFVGFSTYRWSAPMSSDAAVRSLVRSAGRRADVVVAMFHAGAEGSDKTRVPGGREHAFGEDRGDSRHFARTAIDAGADLVVGSGPHVLRGMELYRDRLVAYSLGNLSGWRNFSTAGTSGLSGLLAVTPDPDGTASRFSVTSLRLDGTGVPHVDASRGAERLMRRLSALDFAGRDPFSLFVGEVAPVPEGGLGGG
jgi:Bacterial capsule synthesis protein PGA_cap